MGHDHRVFSPAFHRLVRRQDALRHLSAAFAPGGRVDLRVAGEPGLVGRIVSQHLIAFHLKRAKVDFPEILHDFVGDIAKQKRQSLIAPPHSAGDKMRCPHVDGRAARQRFPSRFG